MLPRTPIRLVVLGAFALALGLLSFAPLGRPYSGALELIMLNGFFVALYLASAWLFDRASRTRPADSPA